MVIKNVNHLTKLKIFNCFRDYGINQEGIKNLQILNLKNVSVIVELIKKELKIYD